MSRVVVVLPLREGSQETARLLIADGPPFDLGASALVKHEVYVTEREAIFVFEGADPRAEVDRLVGDPSVWRAAAAWRECLAGRPRIADEAFTWSQD
jgi:hypothetical protein